ncbi:hypothetical protein [Pseudoxanthomonas mexicana]
MATDFAVAYFWLPVLIGIIVLLGIAFIGRNRRSTSTSLLGLGRSRIARGYLGALVVLFIYSAIDSVLLGRTKVALGHVTAAEAHRLTPGWTLYLFILMAPFVVFLLSIVGLPALALLRRLRFMSVSGALIASQLVAALFALWPAVSPINLWCETHRLECISDVFVSASTLSAAVTLGFAVAAKLPWLRGS